MKNVIFYDEHAANLASDITKGRFLPEDTVVLLNLAGENEVRAAVILNHFEETTVEATLVGSGKFVSPFFIHTAYDHIFNAQNKKTLIMWTSEKNERMNKIHEKFGHVKAGECPNKFGDEKGILWIMTKQMWIDKSKFA